MMCSTPSCVCVCVCGQYTACAVYMNMWCTLSAVVVFVLLVHLDVCLSVSLVQQCTVCLKQVYATEFVAANDKPMHKLCFK